MKFNFAVFTLSLLMILTMVPSAFAQDIRANSDSEAIARANGFAEMAGAIRVTATTQTPAEAAELEIDFGADITNQAEGDPASMIHLYGNSMTETEPSTDNRIQVRATGCFASNLLMGEFSSTRRNRLTLMLPPCMDGGALTISNVLLNIASSGIPVGDGVQASFGTDLQYFLGTGNVMVIDRIVDPIDIEDGVSTVRTSQIEEIRPGTGGTDSAGEVHAMFTAIIEENHARAFGMGPTDLTWN